MDAIMKSWDNALLSEEHTYRAAHRIVLHTHIISTEFARNTWINFAQGLGIIARRSPNICDYTGTDFINMLLSSPGSQISESLFKARTASLKARKGEHIHKRRLLFGCCFLTPYLVQLNQIRDCLPSRCWLPAGVEHEPIKSDQHETTAPQPARHRWFHATSNWILERTI